MIGRILRIVYSLAISVLPLLYLGGYLSFIPGLPKPTSLLNSFGLDGQNFFDISGGGANTLVPFGTMGLSGLLIYQLLSRVGSTVSSVAMTASRPSPEDMMKRMNLPGFMGGMSGGQQSGIPGSLPADISKSQYVALRSYKQGYKNPKEVSKSLSMDKGEVEKLTAELVKNGYLTKGNKLTAKALEILS